MVDFIEYVVGELKSKRLSKTDALSLVKQFSRRPSGAAAAILHPLLQRNTSDLTEQRYSSTFSGEEFFLADHQVQAQKVLPGVAYLEMARAAIEQALPPHTGAALLELRNTVWAQPVVVRGKTEISIALLANDDEQIDFEVFSQDGDEAVVHCQGRAAVSRQTPPAKLDLEQLRAQMGEGSVDPAGVYAMYARMGLQYGASFQAVTSIQRGSGQALAQLRLPAEVADGAGEYVLHPSLIDGALQACAGLIDGASERGGQPRLPFALETLRILAPCTSNMVAWVRFAAGSGPADAVVKLDVDLCDERGNVCVQLHGVSTRVLSGEIRLTAPQARTLTAVPAWETSAIDAPAAREFAEHHVLVDEQLAADGDAAQRFTAAALACFERIQSILAAKPQGKVLLQVVVAENGERALLAGLSGLLKTAAMENPQFVGQLILVPRDIPSEELTQRLADEKSRGVDAVVRYGGDGRQVLRWREVATQAEPAPVAFKDGGVYLITGGRGALGALFAKEILAQARGARVVLTGRGPADGASSDYRQVDLTNLEQVERLIEEIGRDYGRLDGILHCAGMIADNFILKKTAAEFAGVLAPKVTGTFHLDQATRHIALDFFVLFSSIVGATGNLGQADYAAANGFMDAFAALRNRLVAANERRGRTRSINWPLWQEGGKSVDPSSEEQLRRNSGMQRMQTATGIAAFHRALALESDQLLVAEGELAQMRRVFLGGLAPQAEVARPAVAAGLDSATLAEKTQDYLRRQFSGLLKVPPHKIDPRAALENYGIDSILAMQLTNQLETSFGSLPKTLFFEYQTIRDLAEYFVQSHADRLQALLSPSPAAAGEGGPERSEGPGEGVAIRPKRATRRRRTLTPSPSPAGRGEQVAQEPIAIIGLSGRYPEAVDIAAYWENLRDGKDCIVEVPKERWDWREYFTEDRTQPGRHYSKWGGFIAGVDEFDPLFFNISPVDAEHLDPQERLFLQHAWMAVEDAGYTREGLQVPDANDLPGQVGVYAGVMYTEYQLFGAEATARGKRMAVPGSAASIANRVSYAFNLHGPSMTLDTMCSSSLTAIHLACLDLKQGRTSLAIAGGVNVTIHPNKYLVLSGGQFISSEGACQSFGKGGDGYIPGEGVGVVILKRLSEAVRDGNHIYGVIRGSALNHGGKTNGYSVPNPQAQATVISRALAEAKIDARHVSYIEAHGTGTKLGDPIEIAALSKAFRRDTQDTEYCLIGSAKSNIGHAESAAGIAGLTKVLLQMQHRQIVPSLHSAQLNPHIDFPKTPFTVNQELRPWEPPVIDGRTLPRIAGISSFGAGGSNAHIIIEEYQAPARQAVTVLPAAVVLSAKSPAQLRQKALDLLGFIRPRVDVLDLTAVAHTLQVGREAMEERLGFVVTSVAQLVEKLEAYVAGEQGIEDSYQGQVKRANDALSVFSTDADLQQAVDKWIAHKKLPKLLDLWVKGLELDWSKLYGEAKPARVSLPTYPFAKERYWIDVTAGVEVPVKAIAAATAAVLHPLLHSNTSDLSEQRYRSTFTGDEFFLADHQVASRKVLPAVAYLEMARAAVEQALPARPDAAVLELRNTVWAQPVVVAAPKDVHLALLAQDDEQIDYEIFSEEAGEEVVHCQGRALFAVQPAPAALDLEQLRARMALGTLEPAGVYAASERIGLAYGPAFRGVAAIHRGSGEVLAQLRLPAAVAEQAGDYVLHPSVMDSALQAAIGLLDGDLASAQPRLPFALDALRVVARCTPEMAAWVRYAPGSQPSDSVIKLDIDLCDERGNVCVEMRGFSSRALSTDAVQTKAAGTLLAAPVWQRGDVAAGNADYAEHNIVLCELANVSADAFGPHCLFLRSTQPATIAQRYADYALACFELIQAIVHSRPQGKVLLQIAVGERQEQAMLAGLSALLKTAALENPQFVGQLILVPADIASEELGRILQQEKSGGVDALVRYEQGARHVVRWREVAPPAASPVAFKDRGVYLITGGAGGLGLVFAREIVERTAGARVVLTGRSPLSAEKQALLDGWSARVTYRQADINDAEQLAALVAGIDGLTGILHSAGMIADNFILKKSSAEFADVLAPKVAGTFNLDHASAHVDLDFFVLFSSLAGAMGNLGQADYAAANGFMDAFAAYRNRLAAGGQRRGTARSINWPLWQAGGMGLDGERRELLRQTTGIEPMRTATGIDAFYCSLALAHDQLLVAEGDVERMRRVVLAEPPARVEARPAEEPVAIAIDGESLAERTQDYLRKELSALLKMPPHKIDPHAPLERYGIDSILAMKLTTQLEKSFGSLSKTLFFEYQTIAALAGYLLKAHPMVVREKLGLVGEAAAKPSPRSPLPAGEGAGVRATSRRAKARFAAGKSVDHKDVAIVGIAGRYPQAENLLQFWRNLQNGRDCITEIPAERWDHTLYFDPDQKAGKSYSKWGGFIADVDKFDPLFFNISPREASLVDPQERLFLETAWQTIEDAGYTKESISGSRVGVYVGAMWSQYELFGAESVLRGNTSIPTSSHASIANRVSYFFDFHGPSIALDTMCSSSLTAIHLACEELRKGEVDAALAGGVNVTIHPYKYLSLSQGKFAASDGRCRSFGAGGDGYVPGEGVGAVLLKRLDDAVRDGDQIYAVIKASAVNHGGKTNGYTVPNPNAQGDLIVDALKKAKIDPRTLSYIETHGTGTSLGDPIEITGLLRAFDGTQYEKQSCPIGSVKSNIGHLESAAGIAAVTKAVLQLRHEQLVPSLHAEPLNPHINFADSPFYVQKELTDWKRSAGHPRRVGVSSFGAGGSNAHLVLEEYVDFRAQESPSASASPEAFILSARNDEALRRYAGRVADFLDATPDLALPDVAYTLQVGRTPMDSRLAIVAASVDELKTKLREWLAQPSGAADAEGVFHANIKEAPYSAGDLIDGKAGKAFLDALVAAGELEKIARLWTLGAEVDWSRLARRARPRKVSLPTYPFAKERCWIEQETPALRLIEAPAAPKRAEEKRRTAYVPQWTPKQLTASGAVTGPILLLDSSEPLFSMLSAEGTPVVWVKSGQALQETIDSLRERGMLPALVVHRSNASGDVAQQLEDGVYALLQLCQSVSAAPLRLLSVHADDPLGAAMSGFFRTLTIEDPRCAAKVVDIEGDDLRPVLDEIRDPEWTGTQEIRYRGATRFVRQLVPQAPAPKSALPIRQHGVYVITGGMGGLGVIFAEYLATKYQAKLVLVGRSLREEALDRLRALGAEVLAVQADVAKLEDAERVVRQAKARFSEIHGVIHAAGVNRDAFILKKTRDEVDAVLAAKVYGAMSLDLATSADALDFFVLFSSVAGVLGNIGQSDYAYGNRFLDAFAEARAQKRSGRTLSIDWPLWQDGGMSISAGDVALLEKRTGIAPLPTAEGIEYWEDFLRADAVQGVALYGTPSKIAAYIAGTPAKAHRAEAAPPIDAAALFARTESYLKALIGEAISLAPDRISSSDRLESFGIDSVMINRINAQLETDLGALPKTLLYEHETIRDLATFLARDAREALVALFGAAAEPAVAAEPEEEEIVEAAAVEVEVRNEPEAIAIIGIHGSYPHSADLDQYWENLKQGRDLIDLVPASRWDYQELYHPDPAAAADGKIYCKWGGFIDDYDKFDPHFFKIPTEEAKVMDPQERLFLQSVWTAIEDAGYTRDSLRKRFPKARSADVGVFVGVTTNSYHLWAPEERSRGNHVFPAAMPWSIANRVSYFFDFNGPSMPIDTACSSSLVAVHLACESLRSGDCQMAIAGGVNLYLHPAKYHSLCAKRMLSQDGKCHSYGSGDDGFVPGEGVGTVVLKPLSRAIADGDRVYAVIRGSAYDHSGRSNGYSAPNPNAQANLISRTLEKAGIEPETIGYVEGHGTGTPLGDSIEVAALTQAFRKVTAKKQFCPIGSVKANIGHSESAAGIAGIAKVVQQLRHRQLAPTIHSDNVNPNIDFDDTPFYLQHGLGEWKSSPEHPRRALINSFGAGGVNACVVLEEYAEPIAVNERRESGPYLFALSAKNEDRLREYAARLLEHARNNPFLDPAALCYTLQVGREAMEERLAAVVANLADLTRRLEEWLARGASPDVLRGTRGPRRGSRVAAKIARTPSGQPDLAETASMWVAGEEIDWDALYASKPRRVALPTYPFARERYWISGSAAPDTRALPASQLHPLVSYNSSTLREVSFSSTLSDSAFYAVDHAVHEERIFPGAAFLEMACISANIAGEQKVRKIRDIVWARPLSFRTGPQSLRTVLRHVGDGVEYEISSLDDENETIVHSEGRLSFADGLEAVAGEDRVPIAELKKQSARSVDRTMYYETFRLIGLQYGPSFQCIQELYVHDSFALSKLKVAEHLKDEFGQFILHPSIIDGALQTIAGLVGSADAEPTPFVPFAIDEVEIIRPVAQTCWAYAERADAFAQGRSGVTKFNISVLNESGDVLVRIKNLYVRPLARPQTSRPTLVAGASGGRLLSI